LDLSNIYYAGLLQYSVTLATTDSDTSADNLVKRTTNCELQQAVEQVNTFMAMFLHLNYR